MLAVQARDTCPSWPSAHQQAPGMLTKTRGSAQQPAADVLTVNSTDFTDYWPKQCFRNYKSLAAAMYQRTRLSACTRLHTHNSPRCTSRLHLSGYPHDLSSIRYLTRCRAGACWGLHGAEPCWGLHSTTHCGGHHTSWGRLVCTPLTCSHAACHTAELWQGGVVLLQPCRRHHAIGHHRLCCCHRHARCHWQMDHATWCVYSCC